MTGPTERFKLRTLRDGWVAIDRLIPDPDLGTSEDPVWVKAGTIAKFPSRDEARDFMRQRTGLAAGHPVVQALTWCRLGSSQTPQPWPTDPDFHRAEELGLLRHHPTWHATPQGEGILIGLGLLPARPAPDLTRLQVLWATHGPYGPQFVAAFPEGLVEHWHETYLHQRAAAEARFRDMVEADIAVEFFTTIEQLEIPNPDELGAGS